LQEIKKKLKDKIKDEQGQNDIYIRLSQRSKSHSSQEDGTQTFETNDESSFKDSKNPYLN
jgi:hypothetical protein